MAAKKKKSSTKRRKSTTKKTSKRRGKSSGSSSGIFSGKILGNKLPIVEKVVKNKTFQKAVVGAGIVTIVGAGVNLLNQPAVSNIWNKQVVRLGTALAVGDIAGAATVFALENPQVIGGLRNTGQAAQQQGLIQQAGFA